MDINYETNQATLTPEEQRVSGYGSPIDFRDISISELDARLNMREHEIDTNGHEQLANRGTTAVIFEKILLEHDRYVVTCMAAAVLAHECEVMANDMGQIR